MWQGKFLPRWAGRKKVWVMIQRKLKELGGNLWEFSSDVLNFPREVGGKVIFESERAGEETDLEENEGSRESCGGEFHDREFSVGDKKGCCQAWSTATKVHLLFSLPQPPLDVMLTRLGEALHPQRFIKRRGDSKGKKILNCS